MLTYMRKNAGSWIIKVLFAAIIITFVFFYGYGTQDGPEERVLASVGKQKITTAQYRAAYANMLQMYQQMYEQTITDNLARTLGLRQNLLDEMIEQALLIQEAERRNLRVSQEDIKRAIMNQQVMRENGVFSERRYANVLNYMKMTAAEYEQQIARDLMLQFLHALITQAVDVSDSEALEVFRLRRARLTIDFMEFTRADITEKPVVSEEDVQTYYEQNAENYRINEMVRAHYLLFDPDELIGRLHVDEEDIQAFYNADQLRFMEPEQFRARHILLKADAATQPERAQTVRERAQLLLEKIKDGADFAELAEKHSQDEATAAAGGDLGFFQRGVMVPEFEQAVFALQSGEVSDVVETPFGYHIIRLEQKRDGRLRPLAEVREKIERELQKELAEREVRNQARRAFNRLFSSRDLEGYAQEHGLRLRTADYFVFGEGPQDDQSKNAFSRQAFALQPGEISPAFSIDKQYYLIKMTDRKPSHIAPLETVRDRIVAELQRSKRAEQTKKLAHNALGRLVESNFDWNAVAQHYQKRIKRAEFSRIGDFIPDIGRSPELKQAAFSMEAGQTVERVFETDGGFVLVRVREKILPGDDEFEREKEQQRHQLVQAKQQEVFSQYVQKLKERYSVDVDRELFEML